MSSLHERFRQLLNDAEGESEFIIAVVLDVRGFSSFAQKVESAEASAFLRRVYIQLLDNYFSKAAFFKPTGDGLLLVFTYSKDNLKEVAESVISSCLSAVSDFGKLCDSDEMINFKVPENIGIGVCRGAATKLISHGVTLDYSGRPLNIASRLMELARPCGLVLAANFGSKNLPKKSEDKFALGQIYLRGISTSEPLEVLYTKDLTTLPESLTKPSDVQWKTDQSKKSLKSWKAMAPAEFWEMTLTRTPLNPDEIRLVAIWATPADAEAGVNTNWEVPYQCSNRGGKHVVRIKIADLVRTVEETGVADSTEVMISTSYQTV